MMIASALPLDHPGRLTTVWINGSTPSRLRWDKRDQEQCCSGAVKAHRDDQPIRNDTAAVRWVFARGIVGSGRIDNREASTPMNMPA